MASPPTRPVKLPKLGSPIRDHRTRVLQALIAVFVLLVANLLSPKVQDSPKCKHGQHNQRQGPNTDLPISNR